MDAILSHPLLPILTFLFGTLLGHRTALGRDRRQEFNAAALPVRSWVLREIEGPGSYSRPTVVELDALTQRLNWHQRCRFNRAWSEYCEAYREALQQHPKTGEMSMGDTRLMASALHKMLTQCRAR